MAYSRKDDASDEAKAFRKAVIEYTKALKERFESVIRPKLKEAAGLA